MLLVEETKTRFGYDGTAFGPTSNKPVVIKCDICGHVRVGYSHSANLPCQPCGCALKPNQRKESRVYESPTGLRATILVEETIAAFGYDPNKLTKGSRRPVFRECVCGEVKQVPYRQGTRPCMGCSVHEVFRKRADANRQKGLSARGLSLELIALNGAAYRNVWQRQRRQIEPLYALRYRLYASLRAMLSRGYRSKYFDYSPQQLSEHLRQGLERTGGNCPLCGCPIIGTFHIDHKIPLQKAKTEQELLALFSLENLWATCVECNVRVKRGRTLDQITPKGVMASLVSSGISRS